MRHMSKRPHVTVPATLLPNSALCIYCFVFFRHYFDVIHTSYSYICSSGIQPDSISVIPDPVKAHHRALHRTFLFNIPTLPEAHHLTKFCYHLFNRLVNSLIRFQIILRKCLNNVKQDLAGCLAITRFEACINKINPIGLRVCGGIYERRSKVVKL